jgi:hypothetical protein
MAVSIKELQTIPTVNPALEIAEKMFVEIQLIRRTMAAAAYAFATDEQLERYNKHMESSKPA